MLFAFPLKGQLYINEFQASNISTLLDPEENYREWVEIYNSGNSSIDLDGYYLSTDLANPRLLEIENVRVEANNFAIIWLDQTQDDSNIKFQLEMVGGEIALFTPTGELVDSIRFQPQYLDTSFGRSPDGSEHWTYMNLPTPNAPNHYLEVDINVASEAVSFSLEEGFYDGDQIVELSTSALEGEIRYTLDGSWPTPSSLLYTDPISISKHRVIRARLFQIDKLPGPVSTKTYLLNDHSSLPVVSITTDESHFFDQETGIYVEGTNGVAGNCMDEPVNWNRAWERPANIEYFTEEGLPVINQLAGVKIYGGCSRTREFKSLAVIARHKYGDNSLSYNFFQSKEVKEFKSIVLRNSGNDSYYSMLRDGFMQSLVMDDLDLDCQGYQPANVFLNGEYWGILNVREKMNEHYPASNYNLDSDQIDVLENERYLQYGEVVNGTGEHYEDLINFISANSLSNQATYDYVKTQMDVNEYLNYFLTQIYIENHDWHNNNVKYWRPHVDGGKWRWLLYDTDFGWGLVPQSEGFLLRRISLGSSSLLISSLLENEDFKHEFIQRMAGMINTTFHPDRVSLIYDSLIAQLAPEIQRHIDRWDYPQPSKYTEQIEQVIPTFTIEQPGIVRESMRSTFGISGMYSLSAGVNDPNKGYIKASGIKLPDNFSGDYFSDIPLRLEAVSRSGYRFSHWEEASNSANESIYLNLSADVSIRAVFEEDRPISMVYINEVCASNTSSAVDEYGQFDDWIEIYNDNDFEVNLGGWYLSDSAGLATLFQIPGDQADLTTVGAKEYLIIWCDGENKQGPLHCNFKLKKKGEALSLVQQIGQELHYVDSLRYSELDPDLTYGRIPASGSREYMTPTPMAQNETGEVPDLIINEWMTRNCGQQRDEFEESDDWIEIYNPNPFPVDLGGLYLSDSLQNPLKHRIPTGSSTTSIPPYGYKILWADNQPEQGALHLGFKLDGKMEEIGLYKLGQGFLDELSYKLDQSGMAIGRYPDGSDVIERLTASPGESNFVQFIENIYINEYMARNRSTVSDLAGEYDDWIEVYNHNDFSVDIGGLYLTDSLENPSKHRIPGSQPHLTTIPAKGYIILWADEQEEQGALHLDFKLSSDGEQIGLTQADGITFIDSLSYQDVAPDMAIGRLEDGSSQLQVLSASPGYQNHVVSVDGLYISELSASGNHTNPDNSGEFDDWIEIYNHNDFAVDIGGLFITDSLNHLSKYRIPSTNPDSTTIAAKGYLILWADNQPEQGVYHLGFKLSGNGEQLGLVDMDCLGIIDSVSYPKQYSNFTFSRTDNTGLWKYLRPTYKAYNSDTPITGIRINEFSASIKDAEDPGVDACDWIELYNANDFPVDIGGLYLTDTIGEPDKYRIPSHSPEQTTLPPKSFFIFYADDEKELGLDHTNFKLSRKGEAVLLVHHDKLTILDSITYPEQCKNSAFGRIHESGDWWTIPPTPGESNLLPDVSNLVINEVMGNNKTIVGDEYNEYDDWIELYNSGEKPLDVGGLYLSDSLENPSLFRISSEYPDSTTIPSRGHLILWGDNSTEQGILHLGFKISKTGETIGVFNYTQELIDSTSYPFISPNFSWGRLTDGDNTWTSFEAPTPQMTNAFTSSPSQEQSATGGITIYPNPVKSHATIDVVLEEACELNIQIVDSRGVICYTIREFHYGNGKQSFQWNVDDVPGSKLQSGIYYCRLFTHKNILTSKIVVSR